MARWALVHPPRELCHWLPFHGESFITELSNNCCFIWIILLNIGVSSVLWSKCPPIGLEFTRDIVGMKWTVPTGLRRCGLHENPTAKQWQWRRTCGAWKTCELTSLPISIVFVFLFIKLETKEQLIFSHLTKIHPAVRGMQGMLVQILKEKLTSFYYNPLNCSIVLCMFER